MFKGRFLIHVNHGSLSLICICILCIQGVVQPPGERTGKEYDSPLLKFADSSHLRCAEGHDRSVSCFNYDLRGYAEYTVIYIWYKLTER